MNISVVIPVGPGREKLLAYTLKGLSEQSVLPHEVILASNEPLAGIERPDNLTIRTVVSKQALNTGAVNRNRGAALARGEFLFFIDSEVVLNPETVAAYAEDLTEFPMRAIAGPYHKLGELSPDEDWHIFHSGKINFTALNRVAHIHAFNWTPGSALDRRLPWNIVRSKNLYCDYSKSLLLFGGNLIMHRNLFERAGGFWEELNMGEDGAFGVALCESGSVWSFEPRAFGYHIWHPIGAWHDWEPVRQKLMERFHSKPGQIGRMDTDWGWPWEEGRCSLPGSE